MARKAGRTRVRKKPSSEFFKMLKTAISPELVARLTEMAYTAEAVKKERDDLKQRLEQLLTLDQKEAAAIAGIPEWLYAIEFIELWKQKIFGEGPYPRSQPFEMLWKPKE